MYPNEEAHANIVLEASDAMQPQAQVVANKVEEVLNGEKVDAILCVAGGWAGGNAASKGIKSISNIEVHSSGCPQFT